MSQFRVSVHVIPRKGLLDPQGRAVADALHSLGFGGVKDVRVGRHIVIETEAQDMDEASQAVRDMCERLLANPVTEDFEIAQVSAISAPRPAKEAARK
jgi:phosphoribosylformylglycinamidine synthase subunit PurS